MYRRPRANPSTARPAAVVLVLCACLAGATECTYRGRDLGGGAGGRDAELAVGPVDRFGSVVVNGVEYSTAGASFTRNGVPATEADLRPGDVVAVRGTRAANAATGRASSVAVEDVLVGPVTTIDLAAATVTVLGQRVRVTGETSVAEGIEPADLRGLVPGEAVRVSGLRTRDGLLATRLERAPPGLPLRVAGRVTLIGAFDRTLRIGPTTVDWSALASLDPGIGVGSYVAASGLSFANATTLRATRVESLAEVPAPREDEAVRLRGAVTRFTSAGDFDVAGQRVVTTPDTQFVGGTAADVAADRELEVHGRADRGARVVATRIELRAAAAFRVLGPVDALASATNRIDVAGVAITTDARTRWDDRVAGRPVFGFADLRTGDWLEVRGVAGAARTATARVLERRPQPAAARLELQAVPAELGDPSFTLAGVAVATNGATFRDATGQALTRGQFFQRAGGQVVRVRGRLSGQTVLAELVELRPPA